MSGAKIALVAFAAAALAACFNPTFDNPMCGPGGECPSGTSCVQGVCRAGGDEIDAPIGQTDATDAPVDAPGIDAPTDAPAIDAPAIDAPTDAPSVDASMFCPNGSVEGTEQCDDNNTTNTDDCTGICRFNVCGDGHIDNVGARTDTCDDGNVSNTDNCVSIGAQCRTASCGDGFIDSALPSTEDCDDMDQVSGDGCSSACTVEAGFSCSGMPSVCTLVPLCGNGVLDGAEACDDRNGNACGTCNAACTAAITPRAATGSIQCALGSNQNDGETFVLDDGFSAPVVFEWDRMGGVTPGRIAVTYQTSFGQGMMADAVTAAINGVGGNLLITADHSTGGPTATLLHDRLSALGNHPIQENITNAQFVVTGMSGGAGGDCAAGVGCNAAAVCAGSAASPPSCGATTFVCN